MEDYKIIDLYFQRSEDAIRCTQEKYHNYLYTIAYNIVRNKEDAEECVNDVYMRIWQKIPPNRPQRLLLWISKITRNIALDSYRKGQAVCRGGGETEVLLDELETCLPAKDEVEAIVESHQLVEHLNCFFRQYKEMDCNMFLRRYWFGDSILEIATRYEISESAVKSRLFRTRNELRSYLKKEGITI